MTHLRRAVPFRAADAGLKGPRYIDSDQKSPVRPTLSKIARASSIVGRRKSGASRLPYHFFDNAHACGSVIVAPRATPPVSHQRVTSSSDRKSRMFAQV